MKLRKEPGANDLVVALPIPKAAVAAGLGVNLFREQIAAGRIKVARVGGRAVIRVSEIDRFLAASEQGQELAA